MCVRFYMFPSSFVMCLNHDMYGQSRCLMTSMEVLLLCLHGWDVWN